MASAGYTAEHKNFIRTFRLLVDIGTHVLKELLKLHVNKYGTIADFLKKHEKFQDNLPRHQYECLHPTGGASVNMDGWDISMFCLLLLRCCKLSLDEKRAIETIKDKRNTVFCHTANTSLDSTTFNAVWDDLETELLTVLNCIKDTNFTLEIREKIREIKEKRIDGDDIDLFKVQLDLLKGQLESHQSQLDRLNSMAEPSINDRVLRLQTYLLKAYTEYSKMNSFTIGPFENVNVDTIYVEQYLDVMNSRLSTPTENPTDTSENECPSATHQASNFQQLFHLFEERHFVLVGSPGGGKTTFCLKFVSSWYSAVKKSLMPESSLTQSEHDMLNRFRLVYFISMQNAEDEVIEMIENQIFFENKDLIKDAESCFQEIPDDCLVIIDGVDECNKSFSNELPKRNKLNFCRLLWTTRHSKLHLLSTLQNTRILDIAPLDEENVRQLACNLLRIIANDPSSPVDVMVLHFMKDLKKRKMQQLLAENPLILTYFVYQWYTDHGLEGSMTLNYVGVLDLLLKTNENLSTETSQIGKFVPSMPSVLQSKRFINQNANMLQRLSSFAYDCCLQSLYVFEEGPVSEIIGKEHIGKCLKSGLLTKVPLSCQQPSSSRRRIKFFHKTLQELLAAVWICWKDSRGHRKFEAFLENYTAIDQILEISLILIFICGLDSKKAVIISKHVAMAALKDEEFKRYRQSLQGRYTFRSSGVVSTSYRKIKRVQQMMIDCKEEMILNRHCQPTSRHYIETRNGSIFEREERVILPLVFDIIVVDKLEKLVYHILKESTLNLRSIYIDLPKAEGNDWVGDVICKTTQIERLSLDHTSSSVIYGLSKSQIQSIRSLSLCLDNIDELPESFSHLVNIRGLSLSVSGSHRMLEQLEQIFKNSRNLEELELERIVCEEHRRGKNTCEFSIDLSNSNSLKKLKLEHVCSSSTTLPSPVGLKELWLSGATSNASSCISRLSESDSLSSIVLGDFIPFIWTELDYESITSTLPTLLHLEYVYLVGINFERYGKIPTFKSQKKLKYLSLENVQLSRSGWIELLISLVEERDDGYEAKAEVQIFTSNIENDIVLMIAPKKLKKIFLDLKQRDCRDKVLKLNALRSTYE